MSRKFAWQALSWTVAIAAAWIARRVATKIWAELADSEAPVNPADRTTSWGEAAGWAILAGVTAAAARVIARRGAAAAWEGVTGDNPPGVRAT